MRFLKSLEKRDSIWYLTSISRIKLVTSLTKSVSRQLVTCLSAVWFSKKRPYCGYCAKRNWNHDDRVLPKKNHETLLRESEYRRIINRWDTVLPDNHIIYTDNRSQRHLYVTLRAGWNFGSFVTVNLSFAGIFPKINKRAGWNKGVQVGFFQKINKICCMIIP